MKISLLTPSRFAALLFVSLLSIARLSAADVAVLPNVTLTASETITLWPAGAPGEKGDVGVEHVLPDRPRPFDQITDVSVPTLSVFLPPADKRTGAAMLVLPGGGLERLALEHEGYEVAEWLNEHGIAAFVLKYRVPFRDPAQRWKVGVQDGQRAMGIIRSRASEWGVDVDSVGAIGFSAGAELNVVMSVYKERQYTPIDAADALSARPDFNIAIYGGGFANMRTNDMRADIASRIGKDTPPMFIAHAFDDGALSSIILMNALKRANVPSELHIFGAGAHGFGVRASGAPVGQWQDLCLNWLRWQGYLDTAAVRAFAKTFIKAQSDDSASLPRFSVVNRSADVAQAFAAQHRIVRDAVQHGDEIAGYKGAYTSSAAQARAKVSGRAHGVLLKSGRVDATAATTIPLNAKRPIFVETEIGYVIAVDIGSKLTVPRQALTCFEAVAPVIELPYNAGPRMGGESNGLDGIGGNIGSGRFIVGTSVAPNKIPDLDAVSVVLRRDAETLHTGKGADVQGGQGANLMAIINQVIEQGHVIHRGDIIICGNLGGAREGKPGSYSADYGALGKIEFKLE
jgi:2-keto-4-pentenoate hydratase/acetyl esterase/lipase